MIHVVKIGGSLLTRPDVVGALRQWMEAQEVVGPGIHRVMIVGGGALVNALRDLDGQHPLNVEVSHWMAIDLMEVAGRIVSHWIPEWKMEESWDSLVARCRTPGATLFLPSDFLRNNEPYLPGKRLPIGWQVTSDSIAARVAELLGAQRLTLLKSQSFSARSWVEGARLGIVDSHFPEAVAPLPLVECQALPPTEIAAIAPAPEGAVGPGADSHNFNS